MKSLAQLDIKTLIQQELIEQERYNPAFTLPECVEAAYTSEKSAPSYNEINEERALRSEILSFGTFIDHDALSLLVSEDKIIKTWPTKNWSLLMIGQMERFAIFESDDSFHMAILDVCTGVWKEDNEGHMLYFSDNGEAVIDNFHSIIHPFSEQH